MRQKRDSSEAGPPAIPFDPVPVRARHDGWTPERQRDFIAELRRSRSIAGACRAVGMSRDTAYALRRRPGAASFAAAWDAAVAWAPYKGAGEPSLLRHRALYGTIRPVVRGGEAVGVIVKPDNAALLKLYDRFDRLTRNIGRRES